jgi:hypothetical protein
VPEGRNGEGWARLASKLRLAIKQFHSDQDVPKDPEVEKGKGRRSYVEILSASLP